MTPDEAIEAIKNALENVLGKTIENIDRNTVASEVSGWDSLANVKLLIELEMNVGIRFNVTDVEQLPDVGALADLIRSKLNLSN